MTKKKTKPKISASESLRLKYNKMVDRINKKLVSLKKKYPDAKSVSRYRGEFQKATTKNPHYKTMKALYDKAERVLKSGELSLQSQKRARASAIKTFNKMGYKFINDNNFDAFTTFLDDARARGLGGQYTSRQLANAYEIIEKNKLSKKDIQANIKRWSKENIIFDKNGKQVERKRPPKLKVKKGNKEL